MESLDEKIRKIVLELLNNPASLSTSKKRDNKKCLLLIGRVTADLNLDPLAKCYELKWFDGPFQGNELLNDSLEIVIPRLSLSQLAKISLGVVDDNLTDWVSSILLKSRPIYLLREGMPIVSGSKAYQVLFRRYERILTEYGIRIVTIEELVRQKNNKLPQIVTLSDLFGLSSGSELLLQRGAIITYAAKEEIQKRGLQIKYQ